MHRRIGFIITACGMAFIVVPLGTVLRRPDFVVSVVGFGMFMLGLFFAIEAVAHNTGEKEQK
jgi:lipopolysaccharide export LptBFGC system permease protein LptF